MYSYSSKQFGTFFNTMATTKLELPEIVKETKAQSICVKTETNEFQKHPDQINTHSYEFDRDFYF